MIFNQRLKRLPLFCLRLTSLSCSTAYTPSLNGADEDEIKRVMKVTICCIS